MKDKTAQFVGADPVFRHGASLKIAKVISVSVESQSIKKNLAAEFDLLRQLNPVHIGIFTSHGLQTDEKDIQKVGSVADWKEDRKKELDLLGLSLGTNKRLAPTELKAVTVQGLGEFIAESHPDHKDYLKYRDELSQFLETTASSPQFTVKYRVITEKGEELVKTEPLTFKAALEISTQNRIYKLKKLAQKRGAAPLENVDKKDITDYYLRECPVLFGLLISKGYSAICYQSDKKEVQSLEYNPVLEWARQYFSKKLLGDPHAFKWLETFNQNNGSKAKKPPSPEQPKPKIKGFSDKLGVPSFRRNVQKLHIDQPRPCQLGGLGRSHSEPRLLNLDEERAPVNTGKTYPASWPRSSNSLIGGNTGSPDRSPIRISPPSSLRSSNSVFGSGSLNISPASSCPNSPAISSGSSPDDNVPDAAPAQLSPKQATHLNSENTLLPPAAVAHVSNTVRQRCHSGAELKQQLSKKQEVSSALEANCVFSAPTPSDSAVVQSNNGQPLLFVDQKQQTSNTVLEGKQISGDPDNKLSGVQAEMPIGELADFLTENPDQLKNLLLVLNNSDLPQVRDRVTQLCAMAQMIKKVKTGLSELQKLSDDGIREQSRKALAELLIQFGLIKRPGLMGGASDPANNLSFTTN